MKVPRYIRTSSSSTITIKVLYNVPHSKGERCK